MSLFEGAGFAGAIETGNRGEVDTSADWWPEIGSAAGLAPMLAAGMLAPSSVRISVNTFHEQIQKE